MDREGGRGALGGRPPAAPGHLPPGFQQLCGQAGDKALQCWAGEEQSPPELHPPRPHTQREDGQRDRTNETETFRYMAPGGGFLLKF